MARDIVMKAMVVIERPSDRALLVSESQNPGGVAFQRPLGGHVEPRERAEEAARREIREEIGQEISGLARIGVLENIFSWGSTTAHEIVFVFRARFNDPAAYDIEVQTIRDSRRVTRVVWRPAGSSSPPLYPEGVSELLASSR